MTKGIVEAAEAAIAEAKTLVKRDFPDDSEVKHPMARLHLHLNLKAEYFDQIKSGVKLHEFRLQTDYWARRLMGRSFDGIVLKKGYPMSGDLDRTIERPWRGLERRVITHSHFGADAVPVFAIRVN